jgi:hypothetical protein
MAIFVKPYLDSSKTKRDSSFGSSLSTFITTSFATSIILSNLPIYRKDLSSNRRGLEIGMAHGYFLIGPFISLGPLRNSEIANFAGLLSVIGLISILSITIAVYGYVSEKEESLNWNKFNLGFTVGAFGSAGFAFELLNTINLI